MSVWSHVPRTKVLLVASMDEDVRYVTQSFRKQHILYIGYIFSNGAYLTRRIYIPRLMNSGRITGRSTILKMSVVRAYADSAVERSELLGQIAAMIDRHLTRQESEILRSYFGLQMKRVSVEELALRNGVSKKRIIRIVGDAVDKLRFSDDAIDIWKYLYRK